MQQSLSGFMPLKQGNYSGSAPKWGYNYALIGPKTFYKSLNSCQNHQNHVFAVVIIGFYDPKTGQNWGCLAQNMFIILGCNTLNPKCTKPGSNFG
jgi:hypothetical protein